MSLTRKIKSAILYSTLYGGFGLFCAGGSVNTICEDNIIQEQKQPYLMQYENEEITKQQYLEIISQIPEPTENQLPLYAREEAQKTFMGLGAFFSLMGALGLRYKLEE